MNISLTPELEKFVAQQIKGGLYRSASEVVRAALREQKEGRSRPIPGQPKTLEELEQRLIEGIERLDRGEGIDGSESRRRIFAEMKKTLGNGDLHN